MTPVSFELVLEFLKAVAGLKKVPRQGWIEKAGVKSPESVADHSFLTTIIAMLIGDSTSYPADELIKMALLHDLAESITGDITPGKMDKEKKIALERKALKKIMAPLPPWMRREYMELWEEYARGESEISQLMHQINKVEMALQASIYSEDGDAEKFSSFIEDADRHVTDSDLRYILDSLTGKDT